MDYLIDIVRPVTVWVIAVSVLGGAVRADQPPIKGLQEVPHDRVQLRDGFWGSAAEDASRGDHPPRARLPRSGRARDQFRHGGGQVRRSAAWPPRVRFGPAQGPGRSALLPAASRRPARCSSRVDGILDRILAAQQEDGFLISCYIVQDSDKRWENLRLEHQLYNAGHFFEMAVEHHRLTGEDKVLDAAKRFADHIDGVFGPGKRYDVGGHEEVELALVKLYRATGERRYLELARFFLDERGHAHGTERKPFDPSTQPTEIPTFDDLPAAERNRARRRVPQQHPQRPHAGPQTARRAARGHRPCRAGRIHLLGHGRHRPVHGRSAIRTGGRADLAGRGVPQDVRHREPRHGPIPATRDSATPTCCPTEPTANRARTSPTCSGSTG